MTLNLANIGETYKIAQMDLPLAVEKRLEALGMTNDTKISVLNKKGHGTMIVKFRGTRFAIGQSISKNIRVRQ